MSSEFLRVLLFKYKWIKLSPVGETQYQIIIAIKILWSTLSNLLERLVDNAPNLFPLSTNFLYSFLTLLASSNQNNIFSRIYIDLEKVSYQSNHTVDCIFFEDFGKAWKYAGSSITSFIIFFFLHMSMFKYLQKFINIYTTGKV